MASPTPPTGVHLVGEDVVIDKQASISYLGFADDGTTTIQRWQVELTAAEMLDLMEERLELHIGVLPERTQLWAYCPENPPT